MNKKVRNRVLLGVSAVLLVCLSVGATLAFLTDTTGTVQNTFTVGNVSIVNGGLDEADVNEYGEPVDANGKTQAEVGEGWTAADRVTKNKYKLIPGHTYVKDPTIHIDATSEEAYVFFTINKAGVYWSDNHANITKLEAETTSDYSTIAKQIEQNGWKMLMQQTYDGSSWYPAQVKSDGDPVYYYKTTVAAGKTDAQGNTFASSGVIDLPIFKEFKLRGDITEDNFPGGAKIDSMTINITAYVVQADGFTETKDDNGNTIPAVLNAWLATFGKPTTPESGN